MQLGDRSQATEVWGVAALAERALERVPLPVAIAVCDPEHAEPSLIYGNAAFAKLTGVVPTSAKPLGLFGLIGSGKAEAQRKRLSARFAAGEEFSESCESLAGVGADRPARAQWSPLGIALGSGACWTLTLTLPEDSEPLREALTKSEAQLSAIFRYAPVDISFQDAAGSSVRSSPRLSGLHSMSGAAAAGVSAHEGERCDDWAARNRRTEREVVESRTPVVLEESIPLPDGSMEAVTIKFPVVDSSGALQGIGTVSSDVSERRKLEQALHDSKECLRMFFEHAPLYMNLKDAEGRYIAASRQWREFHGLTAQEVSGKRPEEVFSDIDWANRIGKADREVLESGRLLVHEDLVARDGDQRTILTIKFPRVGADGKIIGLGSVGSDITDRRRAERALIQSELEAARTRALLSEAVESMTDGFVWYDNDGKLILCNQKYRELYPRLADDLRPGATYNDLMKLAFDRDQFSVVAADELFRWRSRPDEYAKQTATFRTKTNEGRWIEARNHPVGAGGFIGIRLDVTEQVLSEDALKDSEQRFKDFAQSGPGGFWEMDPDLRISSFFDVQTSSGRSRPAASEAIGRTLWDLFSVDVESNSYWQGYRRDLHERQPIMDLRAAYTDPEGRRYYWRINGKPFYDRAGRFSGYRGVAEDETGEFEARRRAEAAEARLMDAIESLSEGFALFDADDRLVLSNHTYRSKCANEGAHIVPGITFEEIVRANVAARYIPGLNDKQAMEEWIEKRIQNHQAADSYIEQEWSDGRSLLITERRTHDGGITCVISDISELHKARAAAEQANEAKTRFLAAASHDLRQPLHAIELFVAALEATVVDGEAHSLVADIREASEATGRLLNALLDISELDRGMLEGRFEAFCVQKVLDGLQRVYGQQAREKSLELRMVPCSQSVYSDPDLLERILGNLLSNALRYTAKGSVLIGCRRKGTKLRIEVWDTGPGIPEGERSKIFEEFHQLDNPARDRRKGVGLGLSIVRRLAKILGHDVYLKSWLGKGSLFAVELDLAKVSEGELNPAATQARNGFSAEGLEVLVVEDDAQSQKAMSAALESWGCRVLVASDYEEACDLLSSQGTQIDIVIADYRLPKNLNGVEVAIRLRQDCGCKVPVLIVTADQGSGPRRQIEAEGFKSLRKPVKAMELRQALSGLLGKAQGVGQVPPTS